MPKRMLTIAEIALQENIPKRTVSYAVKTGQLKASARVGAQGIYLVSPADLEDWLGRRAGDEEPPVYRKEN